MKKSLRLRIVKALIPCFSILLMTSVFSEINAQNVTGKVFRDFDANGQQTTTNPIEPAVAGVTVKAFKADGTQAGATVSTLADGTYSIVVGTTSQVRIEFSNFPTAYFSGPKGSGSGTSVQFVNGGTTANLGINYPSDYCGTADPLLVTPCYVNGTPFNNGTKISDSANEPFVVTIPYTPNTEGTSTSENKYLSKGFEVGATWGMAYQRSSKFLFTSALLKRHSGFGSGGPGAIYKIDVSGATQVTTKFVDLSADLQVNVGNDPRSLTLPADSLSTTKSVPNHDSTAFGRVGKMSLGDIDISDDEKTLWVINTFDGKLYELPIGSPAVKPTSKIAHTLPDPGCVKGVFRPWAIKVWRGKVYVGGVCTAENAGGTAANLEAYIYSFTVGDIDPNNFKKVTNFPLNYSRGFTSVGSSTDRTSAAWKPWVAKWSDITNPAPGEATFGQTICPQPILSDIEFDVDGSMILGFMDRAGHQLGNANYSPEVADKKVYEGTSAGDLLRMGLNADGTYTLESNGTVNGVTSGGTNQTPPQGPNGGEFYWQDMYGKSADKNYPEGSNGGGHQEVSLGGIALLPGKNEVVETVFDPVNDIVRSGGTRWFDNKTGNSPRGYMIFGTDGGGGSSTFGKANGLGDLELLCGVQPIEVGNRLWNDTNKNGTQDPGEPVLTGVTVELWKSGSKIETKITDAVTGEYFFSGLTPNSKDGEYEIRIPDVSGANKQAKLAALTVTTNDISANAKDGIDSDAIVTGANTYAAIPFKTGNYGENIHTLDGGFKCLPPVAKPNGQNVSICDPISTFDLPDAKIGTEAETWSVLSSPTNATALINAAGVVTAMSLNGTYKFVLTSNSTGCTDTVSIVRNSLPMAGGNQTICSPATTATVNASVTGQSWTVTSKPNGATPTVGIDGKIDGMTIDGNYIFKLSQGDCADEVEILRLAKPDAGKDTTVCSLTSITLKPAISGQTWLIVTTPANPSAATITDAGVISGMVNEGVYQFRLSQNGCFDDVKVTKKSGVTVTTSDMGNCIGGNLMLNADSPDAVTYSWKGPVNFTASIKNPVIANIVDNNMGDYTVTVTGAGGCTASAVSKVSITEISVVPLSGKTSYCVGENIVLSDITLRPTGEVVTYQWTGPMGVLSETSKSTRVQTTADKSQAGLYTLQITSSNNCKVMVSTTVTITECLSIGNLVWDDVNNDGLNNNAEKGIDKVNVKLYNAKLDGNGVPTNVPDGVSIKTTTTGIDGKYLFSGLIPGYYIVEVDAPTGYKSSTGKNGSATGNYEPVISDINLDEPINDDDDGTTVTGTTTIRSKFIQLDNFLEPINDGDTDNKSNLAIDFGLFKPAKIGDFVWYDTNRDGVQDITETAGVSNIKVNLYLGNSTTPLATATTGTDGKYLFDNLIPGTYTVEFVKTSIGTGNNFSPLNGTTNKEKDSDADLITGKAPAVTLIAGQSDLSIDAGISGDCPGSAIGTIDVPKLCVGQTLTLKATSSDVNAKYAWSSNTTPAFSATTQQITFPDLTVSNSGTYTVLITNSNLCTSALTANVVVGTPPIITASSNSPVCFGTRLELYGSGAGAGGKYLWTSPSGTTTIMQNPFTLTASASDRGLWTVVAENANGCKSTASTTVIVVDKVDAGTDQTGASGICESQTTAKLQAAATGQTWSVAANSVGFNTVTIDGTGLVTKMNVNGKYIFVLKQGACTDSVIIERKPRPNAGLDVAFCEPQTSVKLTSPSTGLTWLSAPTNPSTARITANGTVTVETNGSFNFILTNAEGCADTVKVTRSPKPNAGLDLIGKQGICEPSTVAKLQIAPSATEWKVGTKPNGSTPSITATGAITGMSVNGIYEFVLVNTLSQCSDTVKVERSAKPSAGLDVSFCGDSTKYKLPNAPQNTVWSSIPSNPSGTQISGTTGEIIGMTVAGDYLFVLANLSGCADTVKVTRKAIPAFDAKTVQATCSAGASNPDGQLVISGFDVAAKYDFNVGTTYTGTKTFASASTIPTNGILVSNLNPTIDTSYTVVVFNSNGCASVKTVILKARVCECKPDVCIPYSYKKTK